MSNIQFTSVTEGDTQNLIVFADGRLLPPVDNTHPNFTRIRDICLASMQGVQADVDHLVSLFDVAKAVAAKFERLSDRVAVKNGVILLDGDPVHGSLQDQILEFLCAGEEFKPLVEFYEKLLTNPLGDVRAGLYSWIAGQKTNGNFTITPEGDILGYKSVKRAKPEWRTELDEVFVPSRRGEGIVNGIDVPADKFIEQAPGDMVEMPRSRVLNAPSELCGDGLHIGTYAYACDFYGGDTVMLVRFSPRDIVSLPDGNSSWKLRVCRYEVIGAVDEPLEAPVWSPAGVSEPTEDDPDEFRVGTRVEDEDGDEGVVIEVEFDQVLVEYDSSHFGDYWAAKHALDIIKFKTGDEVTFNRGPMSYDIGVVGDISSVGSFCVTFPHGAQRVGDLVIPFDSQEDAGIRGLIHADSL